MRGNASTPFFYARFVSIYIILPTYNEIENLALLAPELLALTDEIRIIIVDDNSPDGTGALADDLAQLNPGRVEVLHRAGKLGLGTAYLAGFHRAFDLQAEWVMTMDADFSHHPRHIPALLANRPFADLIVGSRYVLGGGAVDSPFMRRFVSWGANLLAHWVLGLRVNDVTAGFRLYRREALESIPLDEIRSSGYSFLTEMLYLIQQRGWRVREVPIYFFDRRLGRSKISGDEIFRAFGTVRRLAQRRLRGD